MDQTQAAPGALELGGPAGMLAIGVGLVVLALGVVLAVRHGRRRHALALFAAAWLAVPIGLLGRSLGEAAALNRMVQLGPGAESKDLAEGLQQGSGAVACAALGLLLGLAGAVVALARSREDGPEAA